MERILIVAAHPDDEVLGCGGTVARHVYEGDEVRVLFLAEGVTSRDQKRQTSKRAKEVDELRQTAGKVSRFLGAKPPQFAGFPDNRMDSLQLLDVVKVVEACVHEVRPTIIYTHYHGDLNVDHRIAFQAVLTACRPIPKTLVRAIYSFECLSSTEWAGGHLGCAFAPHRFVDISTFLEKKIEAMGFYESEMRPFPHPRSLESMRALALHRGACCGVMAAEAFEVDREVVRYDDAARETVA